MILQMFVQLGDHKITFPFVKLCCFSDMSTNCSILNEFQYSLLHNIVTLDIDDVAKFGNLLEQMLVSRRKITDTECWCDNFAQRTNVNCIDQFLL
ncbi:hypothetical protein D3C72_1047870 [compost metagenome]